MKYCVKCGKEVIDEEYILDYGYCIDCFIRYKSIFKKKPVLKITICPRCGSWRLGDEWLKPVELKEIIRRTFLHTYKHYVHDFISVIDLSIVGEPVRIYKNRYRVKIELTILFNESTPRSVYDEIEYVLEKRVCPRCIAFTSKSHKAFIQVRSEEGRLSNRQIEVVKRVLEESSIAPEIIEVSSNKYGLDIKVLTLTTAKKIVLQLVKLTGAKVVESFKPTKYDSRSGSWRGVFTLSVRIPSIKIGDLVEYRGRPGIVREKHGGGIRVEMLDNNECIDIDYESYWRGVLKKQRSAVYSSKYRVIAYDNSTLYLLDEETGEMREYPRTNPSISNGDIVYIISVKNKDYIVKI